jgi:hypothetical protein
MMFKSMLSILQYDALVLYNPWFYDPKNENSEHSRTPDFGSYTSFVFAIMPGISKLNS